MYPPCLIFEPDEMKWVPYKPKAKMIALDHIYPEGILIPDYFFRQEYRSPANRKTHMYTTTTGAMKNAFGGF